MVSILLFISSFIYLDREKHKIYYYAVNLEGRDIGTIRIDKFLTDDKLIYKSVMETPFFPALTEFKSKLTLDRQYNLESYSREGYGNKSVETAHLENVNGSLSFVASFYSKFACLENIPIKKETFVFEDDSPVTYMPLIENYNFRRGRSQGFNTITIFSDPSLPPMQRFVTLTSIKDEYLKIDRRRIKTENLILKIRNYPQGNLWIAKSDKSIMRLEIPKIGLKITRRFSAKTLKAEEYVLADDAYTQRAVSFKNKTIQLSGTFTAPKAEGAHPALLLVGGDGPQDRRYQGLFTGIADYLAKNGFCVLNFDKRGIGLSEGSSSASTAGDLSEDVSAALGFMAEQKEVDPKRTGIITHAEGAYYAMKALSGKKNARAMILIAPVLGPASEDDMLKAIKTKGAKEKWTDKYLKTVVKSIREGRERVRDARHNWIYIFGKKCFVKNMKESMQEDPIEIVKKINGPVLIMQSKDDEDVPEDTISRLEAALGQAGNPTTTAYYSYLGHFLGKLVNDGVHRMHYEISKEPLKNIKAWLDVNLQEAPPEPHKMPEQAEQADAAVKS